MTNKEQKSVEQKVKLMTNSNKILVMCICAFALTVLLTLTTSVISGFIVLKIFLYAMILASAIFTIITFITTCSSIYFKVTALDKDKFKEAVGEIAQEIADM